METNKKVLYTGITHTKGGRTGTSHSSDGKLTITLSTPGGVGTGTNPEQLFAAGWSACFIGAMEIAARNLKVAFPSNHFVNTEIDLITSDEGFTLQARLNISLPGIAVETAQSIIAAAQETCPYSKATRGNMKTTYRLIETA